MLKLNCIMKSAVLSLQPSEVGLTEQKHFARLQAEFCLTFAIDPPASASLIDFVLKEVSDASSFWISVPRCTWTGINFPKRSWYFHV